MNEGPVLKADMTVAELVDAIVAYYGADPAARRSLCTMPNGGLVCVYNGPDGKHCAFYWLVKDPSILVDRPGGYNTADRVLDEHGVDILRDEVRHLPYEGVSAYQKGQFFREIQRLHDSVNCWDNKGLTAPGRSEAFSIKERWQKPITA